MTLDQPALTLGTDPEGVQDARRQVARACREIGRDDLVDCAELGVSELVTNAILHSEPPYWVRLRGTVAHPRVEVGDGTTEVPLLPPSPLTDADGALLTYGRGLSLVARSSDAWGAEIEDGGKTMWFTPSQRLTDDEATAIVSRHNGDASDDGPADAVTVELSGAPVQRYIELHQHFHELSREARLLALAHAEDYPFASTLSTLFNSVGNSLVNGVGDFDARRALHNGVKTMDLESSIPASAADTCEQLLEQLDVADEFCRQHRMLALARTPEQVRFENWFLGEHIRQANGGAPMAWGQDAASVGGS